MKVYPHIRPALSADLSAIAEIYNAYLGNGTMDLTTQTASNFNHFLDSNNTMEALFVLELMDEVIGYGLIKQYSDRPGYAKAGETSVYLHKNQLGNGYGTYLKKFIIKECKKMGYHHLVAKIWARNKVSLHYNERLGYELVGIQKEIGWVKEERIDVAILQLIL